MSDIDSRSGSVTPDAAGAPPPSTDGAAHVAAQVDTASEGAPAGTSDAEGSADGAGSADSVLLDALADVLDRMRTERGVDAFVAFRALRSAVRDNGHFARDAEADVAYLSKHRDPVDVARESFALERVMTRAGWRTWRLSSADFKVIVPNSGDGQAIDVFAGFVVDDVFYLMPEVHAPGFREDIVLPLGEVTLGGRRFPAPARPEALLELCYGPQWRVLESAPESTPRQVQRRLDGWMRGNNTARNHWWPFYFGKGGTTVSEEPSPFARWVAEREPAEVDMVDIGSGTGRDSLWFARQGHSVLGLDYIPAATERAGKTARQDGIPARFQTTNLYDIRQVLATGAALAHRDRSPTLYGRFLIHALEDYGRHNLWRIAGMCLRRGGRFYLEFRTGLDAGVEKEFGEHFRKYLDPETVVAEIEARGGQIEHREAGYGFAVYKNEDPHVCRLVATWKR